MKYTFNTKLPYRVIAINKNDKVSYKITQPFKLWIFGKTNKYYDVKQSYLGRYYTTIIFDSKKSVDEFVLKQQIKKIKPTEIIVFDSMLE